MNSKDINTVIGGKPQKDYEDFYNLGNDEINKNNKANNILTVILAMVITAIIIVLIIWGVQEIKKVKEQREAQNEVNDFTSGLTFENSIPKNDNTQFPIIENKQEEVVTNQEQEEQHRTPSSGGTVAKRPNRGNSSSSNSNRKATYKGYPMIGTIEIPTLKISYPVLEVSTDNSLKVSICLGYSPPDQPKALNIPGNIVLMGHNYRNGQFFSNLKKIQKGDMIYLTDLNKNRVAYQVYNIYQTSSTDFDYATRKTGAKREITLSTCTDDVQSRIIVCAVEV